MSMLGRAAPKRWISAGVALTQPIRRPPHALLLRPPTEMTRSVKDGVYTQAQADRGKPHARV